MDFSFCLAQENPVYDSYYFSPFLINPAVTGAELYTVADFSVKKQWVGFPDAPSTVRLSANYRIGTYDFYDPKGFVNKGPLNLTNRIGLGAAICMDKNGPTKYTGGIVSYAYHLPVGQKMNLSFGIGIVGSFYEFDYSLLKPMQPFDNYLLTGENNLFRLNTSIGSYFYCYDYFIGLSANHLLADISQIHEQMTSAPGYFFMAGKKFLLKRLPLTLEPSIILKKTERDNPALDLHAKLYIKRLNWIALSYGTSRNLNFQFGLNIYRMVYLGYRYGLTVSEIANYNFGTHEIHLGINLGMRGSEEIRRLAKKI
jgi:type IX secretion system PorP/SprF family membrane protein